MKSYLDLLDLIIKQGTPKSDRTNTGTLSIFGHQLRYDLAAGFPLVTTKKVYWPAIVHELLWFLSGDTNLAYLHKHDIKIWDKWADEKGNLGPIYGSQWRKWRGANNRIIDQMQEVLSSLANTPDSRRHIVSSWNTSALADMALAPCHILFQFYIANNKLSCHLYQRSADAFLGLPFNIASYALLTHMIAQVLALQVGDLIHSLGDVHIYNNHIAQVKTQLQRTPKELPALKLNPDINDLFSFTYPDCVLVDYNSYPAIKAPIAV